MSLIRFRSNNFYPVFRNVESVFDRFFSDDSWFGDRSESSFVPALNMAADGDAYVISAELPGVKSEDIALNLEDGVLTLSGEKQSTQEDENKRYYKMEQRWGKFSRKIRLPSDVDPDSIKASFENGILEIRIQKAESAKPKQIEIESR